MPVLTYTPLPPQNRKKCTGCGVLVGPGYYTFRCVCVARLALRHVATDWQPPVRDGAETSQTLQLQPHQYTQVHTNTPMMQH